ncbi:MAG TPA: hypothetical protein VHP31_11870 [Caproicibacter sp.]|nr:hypothetical protein [Caproicibacter sp.]
MSNVMKINSDGSIETNDIVIDSDGMRPKTKAGNNIVAIVANRMTGYQNEFICQQLTQ